MSNNLVRHSLLTAAIAGSTLVFTGTLFVSPAPALSNTATADLSVSASVTANCTISTSPVAFGPYDPVGANASSPVNSTGSVTTICTNGANATITLGQGANAAVTSTDAVPERRLSDGASGRLSYALYQDSGRTTIWGNTSGTRVAVTGTGTPVVSTVYGSIGSGQNVPAGNYTDTVVATVSF